MDLKMDAKGIAKVLIAVSIGVKAIDLAIDYLLGIIS